MQDDQKLEQPRMQPVDPSELAGIEGGLNPCTGEGFGGAARLTENVTLNFIDKSSTPYIDKSSTP